MLSKPLARSPQPSHLVFIEQVYNERGKFGSKFASHSLNWFSQNLHLLKYCFRNELDQSGHLRFSSVSISEYPVIIIGTSADGDVVDITSSCMYNSVDGDVVDITSSIKNMVNKKSNKTQHNENRITQR